MNFLFLISISLFSFLFGGVLESKIAQLYKKHYPTIKIEKVIIKNSKNVAINSPIDISSINLKRANGTIRVGNRFLFYKIIAKIKLLKSIGAIERGEKITPQNSALKEEPFKNFYNTPLTYFPKNMEAKFYIPANRPILEYMITASKSIKRGESIKVFSKVGGVEISFKAISLQDGKVGDIIKVKRDKDVFKVLVKDKKEGELQ
jgi:flagella basal body P-ring formation protein FlgA